MHGACLVSRSSSLEGFLQEFFPKLLFGENLLLLNQENMGCACARIVGVYTGLSGQLSSRPCLEPVGS